MGSVRWGCCSVAPVFCACVCSDTYEQPARKNVCCFLFLVLKLQVHNFLKQIDVMKEKDSILFIPMHTSEIVRDSDQFGLQHDFCQKNSSR